MAEYFREFYKLDVLNAASGYICRDEGRMTGLAINLDADDEYGSGGQLVLSHQEVIKLYPIFKNYMEEFNG